MCGNYIDVCVLYVLSLFVLP